MPSAQDPTLLSLSAVYHFLQEVFSRERVGFSPPLPALVQSGGAHVAKWQFLTLQRPTRRAWEMMASWLFLSLLAPFAV